MNSFETAAEAQAFVRDRVDTHIPGQRKSIENRLQFQASTVDLGDGRFTNVYDVSYRAGEMSPTIHVHDQLTSVYGLLGTSDAYKAATGGGFFFLADRMSGTPRQLALNLSMTNGIVRSLPVVDRETVILKSHALSAAFVQSLGLLSINGEELSWSGSLTDHETDAKVYGNGNTHITHEQNEATGKMRVLDERSRFTPAMQPGEMVDIGFVARGDGSFAGIHSSREGNLDIFPHDFVLRCPERFQIADPVLNLRTIDSLALDSGLQGALSVGPMLETADFTEHPVNKDASLGGMPPFVERPLARIALYESEDNMVHLRLFDGRPGSETFTGVTPSEAVKLVEADGSVVWGCFLDPGQTAKLCVRTPDGTVSLGNTHYLKWATNPGDKYIWTPEVGRPTASAITLQ
jgi:hypothetical protein